MQVHKKRPKWLDGVLDVAATGAVQLRGEDKKRVIASARKCDVRIEVYGSSGTVSCV